MSYSKDLKEWALTQARRVLPRLKVPTERLDDSDAARLAKRAGTAAACGLGHDYQPLYRADGERCTRCGRLRVPT